MECFWCVVHLTALKWTSNKDIKIQMIKRSHGFYIENCFYKLLCLCNVFADFKSRKYRIELENMSTLKFAVFMFNN